MSSVPDVPAALSGVKGEIAKLEADVESGTRNMIVKVEGGAKSFYEKHLPLFAFLFGLAAGALAMLAKLKL